MTPDSLAGGGMIPLIASLMRLAGAVAAGGAVPIGLLSDRTIMLAEGVLRMMFITKLKIAAVASLVVVLMAAGVGKWSLPSRADDSAIASTEPPAKATEERPAEKPHKEWLVHDIRTPKQQEDIAWGEKAHGLQAGISFRRGDQTTYEIGQSVTFVVYLRNVSDKEIRFSHIEPLFEEQMPVVEDAKSRRFAVVPRPLNLGDVPIVHRSLEPRQRITLAYPWFRIRPLGWNGEVIGPTCALEPGSYKVGFTIFLVRLNEGKDISLGTKKVELNVRKNESGDRAESRRTSDSFHFPSPREAGKPRSARETASSLSATNTGHSPPTYYLKTRSIGIPIPVAPLRPADFAYFNLFVSGDEGETYHEVQKIEAGSHLFRYTAHWRWYVLVSPSRSG